MKHASLILLCLATMSWPFTGCQTVTEIIAEMSDEEAVETIEQCLAGQAGGFTKFLDNMVIVYASTNDSCALDGDTTITLASTTGATTYSYALTYDYTLNCTTGTPNNLSNALNSSGSFDGPRVSSTDNGAGNSTLSDLGASMTEYDFDGVYERSGTVTSKIAQKGTFTYNFAMLTSDIKINKSSQTITSGTATFTFAGVGTTIGSTSYNYMGSVTFNGNNSATLTLGGNDYTIDIN